MKARPCVRIVGIVLMMPLTLFADLAATNLPVRTALTLSDGSRILGTSRMSSIPFQTAYARMDIPLRQVQDIRIGDDHETVALTLTNGDRLKGTLQLKPIELETLFGQVMIDLTLVAGISVYPGGKGSLPGSLQEGLVLYYSFDQDEGGKVTDASGKGHDGAVNGATWTAEGKLGGAYKFDGKNDYVTVSGYKGLYGDMSVAIWFRHGHVSSAHANLDPFVTWGTNADAKGGRFVCGFSWMEAGKLTLFTQGNSCPVGRSRWDDGKWHQAVFAMTSNGWARIYVDGALDADPMRIPWTPMYDVDTRIGVNLDGGVPYASSADTPGDGALDEVRIYGRALSADEVKDLYNAQNQP